jgi:polyhydroxyalkanoate synthase
LPLFLELLRSETATSAERRAAALRGLRAYQEAERGPPRAVPRAVAQAGRAALREYGGSGRPVVFVPSLINPPFVLNLAPGNSLVEHVAQAGFSPLVVDWGVPTPEDRAQDVTGHVEQLLLPLLDALGEPPVLIGYCLGGTMALAAACARRVAGLALIATPWHFAAFPPQATDEIDRLWDQSSPACDVLGVVPMEVLQSGFWRLEPARTIAKFERFGALDPASADARAFVALEDWANQGAPLTFAAGRQLFDDFFAADLPGTGRWTVADAKANPAALPCPTIEFVSLTDRIVPAATSAGLPGRHETSAGHVGMVVGSRAPTALWEPLTHWIGALPSPI